jgi:diguanylate cyclase (GGDEF)-like protein
MSLLALLRPLAPGARPWLRLLVTLALGLGVAGSALLASLRGRGPAEQLAFYAFLVLCLDGLGQLVEPLGWPAWPALALFVGALAVAEPLRRSLPVAALAALLAGADAVARAAWRPGLAAALGYLALVLAIERALAGEKKRLSGALGELARLKHGIDQLDEDDPAPPSAPAAALRQVSEGGRRARQAERAEALDAALASLAAVARQALGAHCVAYFQVDRERELAYLRAADGPPTLARESSVPLASDPFSFVLERRQPFYATDFRRLLWALPFYRGEVRIGSLLAVPVWAGGVIDGVFVADRLEVQQFTGGEPELLEAFAALAADAIARMRAAAGREDVGEEFKAIYPISQTLATLSEKAAVRRLLLRSARDLVPLDAAAVVTLDESQTRYTLDHGHGWAKDYEGREVALSERTWAAWTLRSAEDPYLLDNLAGEKDRMPILVLDEGSARAESLLAIPLKARNRTLGALMVMGKRGSLDAASRRVLGILCNQGAAALSTIRLVERLRETAVRDGLTGLYNRRAFDDFLPQALARQDRQGGSLALLLLDLDSFKKLNDTFGHPAGDAALRHTARLLERHLRRGDQAARFGGEEFVVMLPGTDDSGARQLAERVRVAIHEASLVFEGARLRVTASFGVAVWPTDGKEPQALLAAADRALYSAKQSGRNKVVAASALPSRQVAGQP